MKLLQELLENANEVILVNGFSEIERRLGEMRNLIKEMPLTEGFTDNHRGDLDRKFDDIERKLLTARRMLGKINGANFSPDELSVHKSKIMRYINIFRKQLYDVMIELGMSDREMQYHLDRIDLDREHGKPAETFTHQSKQQDVSISSSEAANVLGVTLSRVRQFVMDGRLKSNNGMFKMSDIKQFKNGGGDKINQERNKFSDIINAKRNIAAPEDVGGFKQPKAKTGENHKKWYQRIFR